MNEKLSEASCLWLIPLAQKTLKKATLNISSVPARLHRNHQYFCKLKLTKFAVKSCVCVCVCARERSERERERERERETETDTESETETDWVSEREKVCVCIILWMPQTGDSKVFQVGSYSKVKQNSQIQVSRVWIFVVLSISPDLANLVRTHGIAESYSVLQ